MLFNSISFAIFLPIVFLLYWFAASKKLFYQNLLLLTASYFFYASWDYRFLFLLMFSTLLDFYSGLKMSEVKTKRVKRFWFWLSIVINLGLLALFKYYNFFATSFSEALKAFGIKADFITIKVILPVGISFYTFHGLSYVIDIYNNKIRPQKNFIDYAVFVSFFPLLVAGPIERATHLLPQIKKKRFFSYTKSVDGLRQILWGLFKKVVIADGCASYADLIFNHSLHFNGSTLLLGAIFFAFQIYCDFSGYSDIAIGTAKLFGIDLLRNFAYPYFSRDIAEFWRRWHISLSSWFRDYLYIPLGGSKGSTWSQIKNIFIIFIISGFWHGANWTFVAWGTLNAIYFMPLLLTNKNRKNIEIVAQGKVFPSLSEFFSIILTFILTVFAWVFFRSENITYAFNYIESIFSPSLFSFPEEIPKNVLLFVVFLIFIEWCGREQHFALEKFGLRWPFIMRWGFYICLGFFIFLFAGKQQPFIYFQF